jgi:quercetin dioxygenase-like cupin family protein
MHMGSNVHSASNLAIQLLLAALGVSAAAGAADAPTPPQALTKAIVANASSPDLKWGPCPPLFAAGCQIAVLQGDPAKPNADVFFRVPAGYRITAHTHSSAEHLVLVTGELEVQYQGQPAAILKAGDFAYGPPRVPHVGRCLSKVPCTLFIAFELAVDAAEYTQPIRNAAAPK